MQIQTLHVFGNDYPVELTWNLLAWCREHDAIEFSVDGILTDGGSRDAFVAFDTLADEHRLPLRDRYDIHAGAVRSTELWALNDATVSALQMAFPKGYFDYFPDDAWFENLSVYRGNGDLILGVITHESEGILRVTAEERADLDRRALPYREKGEWVGFNDAAV